MQIDQTPFPPPQPQPTDENSAEDLEEEIERVQRPLVDFLDEKAVVPALRRDSRVSPGLETCCTPHRTPHRTPFTV